MSSRRILSTLVAFAFTIAAVSCGKSTSTSITPTKHLHVHKVDAATPLKLAFVTNNASEFWKIAEKGLEKARAEGMAIDLKMPLTGKVEEQKKILEDLVSQGYHGVAVSAIAAEDMARDINKAAEKLNIITHDSDSPKSNRICYIGTNNREAGRQLGREIVKLLPNGGKMAVFVGTLAADNARDRLQGIKDEIEGKGIEIVAAKEDNKNETLARTNVEDMLNAHPDIDLLAGLWEYNPPAMLSAVKASGKEGKILMVGFDENISTLQGIEDGHIACTCVQKPFQFGYQSAELLTKLAREGETAIPAGGVVDTGVEIIHKGNVAEFKAKLAAMKE